jgi:hypothetical protein
MIVNPLDIGQIFNVLGDNNKSKLYSEKKMRAHFMYGIVRTFYFRSCQLKNSSMED